MIVLRPGNLDDKAFKEMCSDVREDLPQLLNEDDNRRAGWFHDYFCDDGTQLTFDREKPFEHICPKCGNVYNEQRHHEAWVTQLRCYTRIEKLVTACGLSKRDPSLMDVIIPHLDWLAEYYRKLPLMDGWAAKYGAGHIDGTTLGESVVLCGLALGIIQVRNVLDDSRMSALKEGFLVPAYDLQLNHLYRFSKGERGVREERAHNITVWHACALGCTALAMDDDGRLEQVFKAPHGLDFQFENGIMQDGLWFEGSMGYHLYTVKAITHFIAAAKEIGKDLPGLEKNFLKMLENPVKVFFSNGFAPAYGDMWADPDALKGIEKAYSIAADLFDDKSVHEILDRIRKKDLVSGQGTKDFPGYCIAKAQWGKWEVSVKSGYNTPSHAHPDVGSLILLFDGKEKAGDLGTSGYASESVKWFKSTFCHNTVAVDDTFNGSAVYRDWQQDLTTGERILTPDSMTIKGKLTTDCMIHRTLEYKDDTIIDTVRVSSDEPRKWTWWMHLNNPFEGVEGSPDNERFGDIGFIHDVMRVEEVNSFSSDNITLTLDMDGESDGLYVMKSKGNRIIEERFGIAWDKQGKETEFKAVWRVS